MKKKIGVLLLSLVLTVCLCGCGNDVSKGDQANNVEQVAAVNVEAWFEHDFETMLKTYPNFRLRYRAVSFGASADADVKTVALAMSEYYESAGREVEILSTTLIDQYEVVDYSMYNEIKEKNEYITTDDFGEITEVATVRVDYSLDRGDGESVVLDDDIKCIKMSGQWLVLYDVGFTN